MNRDMNPRVGQDVEGIVSVDGYRLRISVRGNGPPLLILNGLGGRIRLLDRLRLELDDFQTIAFDAPGIGESPQPRMTRRLFRLRHYAELAEAVVNQLGFGEGVNVLGVSLGGSIAQELAHRHPDLVRALVLASATSIPYVVTTPSAYLAFFDPRRSWSHKRFLRSAPALYGGLMRGNSELAGVMQGHFEPVYGRGRLRQLFAASTWTSLLFAHRIRQPTLLLTGTDDPLIPPYNSRILKTLLPNARLEVFEGEGHLLVVTSPERTAASVRRFLLSPFD